jgi:DNA polymerase-3 subunit chi
MSHKVFYVSVKTASDKIKTLVKLAYDHYSKNQKLLILTPDSKASEFIDKLLWAEPPQSFIPHFISQTLLNELIVITEEKNNLNGSKVLLNLSAFPIDFITYKAQVVLELEDLSSKAKADVFKKKLQSYQKAGATVVSIN